MEKYLELSFFFLFLSGRKRTLFVTFSLLLQIFPKIFFCRTAWFKIKCKLPFQKILVVGRVLVSVHSSFELRLKLNCFSWIFHEEFQPFSFYIQRLARYFKSTFGRNKRNHTVSNGFPESQYCPKLQSLDLEVLKSY